MPTQRRRRPAARVLGSPLRNLGFGLAFMILVMALATGAYVSTGWSLGDAIYMVVLTVYTVGFSEVRPIDTPTLRSITIALIVFGCTTVIFLTGAVVQWITVSEFEQIFGIRRMTTQIEKLKNHVIVCGFGRIGVMVSRTLRSGGADFVILDTSEERIQQARAAGYLCMVGDATDETFLMAAGVKRARALATVLPNDAANVFITLSARSLNPSLEIIARGEAPTTETKLLQAGANQVVLPAHIGAERIAGEILYRQASHFVRDPEQMRSFENILNSLGLDLEVVVAAPDSPVIGQTIAAVEAEAKGAFFIVRINRHRGVSLMPPQADTRIEPRDGLVLVGRGSQARAMNRLFEVAAQRMGEQG